VAEGAIETFMSAIRRLESGSHAGNYAALGRVVGGQRALGAYQIMSNNWPGWAAEAGISGADWHDPMAQNRVARYKMLQYYNRFGSWELVAIAWFAGPGAAQQALANGTGTVGGRKDANGTSVNTYLEKMRIYMAEAAQNMGPRPDQPSLPAVYSPPWMTPTDQGGEMLPPAEETSMAQLLTETLDTMSAAAAGGTRRLPELAKPEILGSIEPPGPDQQAL